MGAGEVLERARKEGRAALIGYWPAGFPSVAVAGDAVRVMAAAGADLVEVGIPYSDPVMDGPVIQRASELALQAGVRPADALDLVAAVAGLGIPALVMTYWNLVERYRAGSGQRGAGGFAADLAAAGGSGLITPDLIPEEAASWLVASNAYHLDRVFLVAPSSSNARLASTVGACRGFVYATSVMGVTGARDAVSQVAPALVARVRAIDADIPVGVGLGVRDGGQAATVASYADAVIVGSALVSCLLDASSPAAGLRALERLTAELANGVRQR